MTEYKNKENKTAISKLSQMTNLEIFNSYKCKHENMTVKTSTTYKLAAFITFIVRKLMEKGRIIKQQIVFVSFNIN